MDEEDNILPFCPALCVVCTCTHVIIASDEKTWIHCKLLHERLHERRCRWASSNCGERSLFQGKQHAYIIFCDKIQLDHLLMQWKRNAGSECFLVRKHIGAYFRLDAQSKPLAILSSCTVHYIVLRPARLQFIQLVKSDTIIHARVEIKSGLMSLSRNAVNRENTRKACEILRSLAYSRETCNLTEARRMDVMSRDLSKSLPGVKLFSLALFCECREPLLSFLIL